MRSVWFWVGLATFGICAFLGFQYYKYRSDPLVAGISPRENADGTIDYTLIGKDYSKKYGRGMVKIDLLEWVLRLPKGSVSGSYGAEDMSVSGGGVGFSHSGRPNLGYYLWLRVTDLKPTKSLKFGKGFLPEDSDGFSMLIQAEKSKLDDFAVSSRHIKNYCKAETSPYPELQSLSQNMEYADMECRGGLRMGAELNLVKWSETNSKLADATIVCLDVLPDSCDFRLYHGNRMITGHIARKDLARFAEFSRRLHAFITSATIVDRDYIGNPYVYGK
jgi:hypothetical protein